MGGGGMMDGGGRGLVDTEEGGRRLGRYPSVPSRTHPVPLSAWAEACRAIGRGSRRPAAGLRPFALAGRRLTRGQPFDQGPTV